MNTALFSYLESRVRSSFDSSNWNDRIGRDFGSNELQNVEKTLRHMDELEEEIAVFIKSTADLLKE